LSFAVRVANWVRAIAPRRSESKIRFADLDLLAMSPHLKADLGLVDIKDTLGRHR
jgi:hypothetical protein